MRGVGTQGGGTRTASAGRVGRGAHEGCMRGRVGGRLPLVTSHWVPGGGAPSQSGVHGGGGETVAGGLQWAVLTSASRDGSRESLTPRTYEVFARSLPFPVNSYPWMRFVMVSRALPTTYLWSLLPSGPTPHSTHELYVLSSNRPRTALKMYRPPLRV